MTPLPTSLIPREKVRGSGRSERDWQWPLGAAAILFTIAFSGLWLGIHQPERLCLWLAGYRQATLVSPGDAGLAEFSEIDADWLVFRRGELVGGIRYGWATAYFVPVTKGPYGIHLQSGDAMGSSLVALIVFTVTFLAGAVCSIYGLLTLLLGHEPVAIQISRLAGALRQNQPDSTP